MDKQQAKKRIEKLKKAINHYRYLCHVLDRQDIDEGSLDSLKHELWKLEREYPEFFSEDSPTQRVEGKPLKYFKKVEHETPMLSIEDIFSEKELSDWQKYLERISPGRKFEYYAEMKIDGFAVTLIYENGLLSLGSTRGNGAVGEDVTQNLKTVESIPLRIDLQGKLPTKEIEEKAKEKIKKGIIEVRGEVYINKEDFRKLNAELEKKKEKTFANPRNLAAGSIRQLDPKLAASRPLRFLAYDMVTDLGQKKHSEKHEILPCLGFKTNEGKVCGNLQEIVDYWKETSKIREKVPFQIDGVVITVNEDDLLRRMGRAGKGMRGTRALKFAPERSTTRIRKVVFQIGRTGAVTPVAGLDPVRIGGTVVSRATLHNEDEIKRLGVKIGDTVIVGRAGDVIPDIIKPLPELRTGEEKEIIFPKECPVCKGKLFKEKGEAVLRCRNKDCGAVAKEELYHFVSKKAFDIEGMGPKIINQLMDAGLVSSPSDIFELKEGDLVPLERFAEKSAENLVRAIMKSKEIPLSRFIYALSIRQVGEETSSDLADYFGSLKELEKASLEDLRKIPDIGSVGSESIHNWFRSKKSLELLKKLQDSGVKIISPGKKEKSLKDKTFVFTGSLESLSREEAKNRVRMLGGSVSSSISKETDCLVAGENPGSKLEKAESIGVKIVSESDFLKMIK